MSGIAVEAAPKKKYVEAEGSESAGSEGVAAQHSDSPLAAAALHPFLTAPRAEPQPSISHFGYASIDRAFKANLARLTFGLSRVVLAEHSLRAACPQRLQTGLTS